MIDIKMDLQTGDIVLQDGDLVLVDNMDSLIQGLYIRLRTFKGEWYRDTRIGLIDTTVDKPSQGLLDSRIRSEIMAEDGVKSITSYTSTADNKTREMKVTFACETIYGKTPETTIEVSA